MIMNIGVIVRTILWWFMNLISALLVVSLYLVKSKFVPFVTESVDLNYILSYVIFFGIPLLFSGVCILLPKLVCAVDSLNSSVQKVSSANKEYLPVYLSYFFVSLSIPGDQSEMSWAVLSVMFLIIWIFTSLTKTYYFNPLLLLFGYKFYNVTSHNGIELFVISNRTIRKDETNITFPRLRKITEYVYLEIK